MEKGVLACQQIEQMIAERQIFVSDGDDAVAPEQIQPASLDLRLGRVAYRVRASFLPSGCSTVLARLKQFKMHEIDMTKGAVLEKGCVYVMPLLEKLDLPDNIEAMANAKSSIGRLDLLSRIIIDEGVEFDRIPAGYKGALYIEICPRSFPVLVRPGMRLNQIRFRCGKADLDDDELRALHEKENLVTVTDKEELLKWRARIDKGLSFSVDLSPAPRRKIVGYKAKAHTDIIDLSKMGHYEINQYWEALYMRDGSIILDPGAFYILKSLEAIHIPPDFAAEMVPYFALVGEFRVHYAGFFDPGFGHDGVHNAGSHAVLEVRCHEAPFILEHGQTVGCFVYERMSMRPKKLYGKEISSHYQGQGLRLSKHFSLDSRKINLKNQTLSSDQADLLI